MLLALIDECPVIHAGVGFEFISENRQIASVREFMRSLPGNTAL